VGDVAEPAGCFARFADVAEDVNRAGELALAVADRSDGILDRNLFAVTADKQRPALPSYRGSVVLQGEEVSSSSGARYDAVFSAPGWAG